MLKTISQVGKAVWSDIIFIIIIYLLLLSLYAFVYHNLPYISTTTKS